MGFGVRVVLNDVVGGRIGEDFGMLEGLEDVVPDCEIVLLATVVEEGERLQIWSC